MKYQNVVLRKTHSLFIFLSRGGKLQPVFITACKHIAMSIYEPAVYAALCYSGPGLSSCDTMCPTPKRLTYALQSKTCQPKF